MLRNWDKKHFFKKNASYFFELIRDIINSVIID